MALCGGRSFDGGPGHPGRQATSSRRTTKRALLRPLYIAAGLTGGLCLLYALLGGGLMSFSGPADEQFKQYPDLLMALVADRQGMLSADAWRSFGFIAAVAALLFIYLKKPF